MATSKDIQVRLQYLANDPLYEHVKPLQITPNYADKERRTNVKLEEGPLETLHDVSDRFEEFTLDGNGFQYVHAPTHFKEWTSQPEIGRVYLKELEELLRCEIGGCDEVLFYDARIRQAGEEGLRVEGLSYNPFARQVHVDNTDPSCIAKIRNLTDMKADYLLQGRCRIINIWRPIKHPVYDCGLALADGASLRCGDVIECDRYNRNTNQLWDTMGVVKHRPGYQWYYLKQHHQDDVILFKNYDSDKTVSAPVCLHTAFDMPASEIPAGAPTRESIEVRALVFTHPIDERRLPESTLHVKDVPMQQPLVTLLEQGQLKHIDDDDYSTVDRIRKDIDEAKEVKDAELLLRKRKIRDLERTVEALVTERDLLREMLASAQQQIDAQAEQIEALECHRSLLQQQLSQDPSSLRKEVQDLSARLTDLKVRDSYRPMDERDSEKDVLRLYGSDGEKILLTQQAVAYKREAEKWKAKAEGQADVEWQIHCDKAINGNKVDEAVIRSLRRENESLREENDRLKASLVEGVE